MQNATSDRGARSPRNKVSASPQASAPDSDWEEYTKTALRDLDRTIDDKKSPSFPGLPRGRGTSGNKAPQLSQVEALEAANAIDAVLRKRSEPVHERLKDSLVAALRSRAKISKAFSELDVTGVAASRGIKTGLGPEDGLGGAGSFGKQLAASWTSLPDTGLTGGRSRLLEKLDGTQAARVRGLLTHLEFTIQADRSVSAASLLNMSPNATWYDGPLTTAQSTINLDDISDEEEEDPIVSTLPQEDPWPYDRVRIERRSRTSGRREYYKISGSSAQRLMSFRENLRMAYNSLGEAFAAMDMDARYAISFDHFHAHLVRLKLGRCDAEGSLRAAEIFKLLDSDNNDLITPNDCLRAYEAAAREIRKEMKQLKNEGKFHQDALKHGYADGKAHVRFDKKLRLTGDDALRVFTLRRFYELQGRTLVQGLSGMDLERSGFLTKEAFICGLIEDGYCVSASEAMDLFKILDIHKAGSLSLKYLDKLDEGERLGVASVEHRPPASPRGKSQSSDALDHPQGHRLPSGIGSGGLFSDPGRLDGPAPPPRPHARLDQLRDWDRESTDDVFKRLHTQTTESYEKATPKNNPRKASQQPKAIIDDLLARLDRSRPVRASYEMQSSTPRNAALQLRPTELEFPSRPNRTDERERKRAASPGAWLPSGGLSSPRQRGDPPPTSEGISSSRPASPSPRGRDPSPSTGENGVVGSRKEKTEKEKKEDKKEDKVTEEEPSVLGWLFGGDEEEAKEETPPPEVSRRARRLRTAQRVGGWHAIPKFKKTSETPSEENFNNEPLTIDIDEAY